MVGVCCFFYPLALEIQNECFPKGAFVGAPVKNRQEEGPMKGIMMGGPLNSEDKKVLDRVAATIRNLSIDGVQKANSGHPGLPMGCAELGAYIYGCVLQHNPKHSNWVNRDRFILSAGHGSMFLYSCLHLAGFDLSIEELKNFRQLHSKTPGHPEFGETDGVETTTGPLGQGVGHAVGQALGLKLLASKFNTEKHPIFSSKIFVLAGDGCIMEGIAAEACSLAGHLKLNNLVLIYDANNISLDGPLSESCSEDSALRFKAYGWDVHEIDGHDFDAMHKVFSKIHEKQERPVMIMARTVIGKGSPNKAGTHKVHGAPLGEEEVMATKKALDLPEEPFYVPQAVKNFFDLRNQQLEETEKQWREIFAAWSKENPELYKEFEWMSHHRMPDDLEAQLMAMDLPAPCAGRKSSHQVLNFLSGLLPQMVGGSADLSCSDLTMMDKADVVRPGTLKGRNVKFGVREFGMCTMAVGMAQTGMMFPFIGTFLTFSDYMRNGIRLAALMKTPMVFQFTHDSVLLGEDGPTHQPVEHYASLRAIPGLNVIRPAGPSETKMAWLAALRYQGPTALILSRQNIAEVEGTKASYDEGMGRGAYIVRKEKSKADYMLIATGSELPLAMNVAEELEKRGKQVRVVSMPCWELFETQSDEYKKALFGGDLGIRVSIEAGIDQGWHKYIGMDGIAICMEGFGASAPGSQLAEEFGFTTEMVLERIL